MINRHPVHVVFICIGNSCRSQIAEGFARHKYSKIMEPQSMGTHPAPLVQPETIACMKEKGVDLNEHSTKTFDAINWNEVDLIINMSNMPVLGSVPQFKGDILMWNVKDPMGQSVQVYHEVRDKIEVLLDRLAVVLENQSQSRFRKRDNVREG